MRPSFLKMERRFFILSQCKGSSSIVFLLKSSLLIGNYHKNYAPRCYETCFIFNFN
jgi:hypothetical protein